MTPKRIALVLTLLLLCIGSAFAASFLDLLKRVDFDTIVRPPDGQGYIGTIILKVGKCELLFESEGAVSSIMSTKVVGNTFSLLIKQRWIGDEEFRPGVPRASKYYLVQISQETLLSKTNEVNATREANSLAAEIKAFGYIVDLTVNDNRVNVRSSNKIGADRIVQVNKGIILHAIAVGDEYVTITGMSDYWFHVNDGVMDGWVFGFFLDGKEVLTLN